MLYAEKRKGLVHDVTCVTFRWKGGGRVIIVRGCFLHVLYHQFSKPTLTHFCGDMAGDRNDERIDPVNAIGVSFRRRSSVKHHVDISSSQLGREFLKVGLKGDEGKCSCC